MGAAILPDLAAEILIPVCAVIGIAFALVQWVLVSNIKLSPARDASGNSPGAGGGKNGCTDYLIEEEEGLNDHNVVIKCAEIQSAISEGELFFPVLLTIFLFDIFEGDEVVISAGGLVLRVFFKTMLVSRSEVMAGLEIWAHKFFLFYYYLLNLFYFVWWHKSDVNIKNIIEIIYIYI